jgi:transcriptional regulator with XRE-family HTH domain
MSFGHELRNLRLQRGLSLRGLGTLAHCSHQTVNALERGEASPSPAMAASLDAALNAGGTLKSAATARGDEDVQRRALLKSFGLVAAAAPLIGNELVRNSLEHALGNDRHIDDWAETATEYGFAFYTTDPAKLIEDLTVDLTVLDAKLATANDRQRADLCRAASQMAVVSAMAWSSVGNLRQARWWWKTARRAADTSRDPQVQAFAAGWEVANGTYELRPVPIILARAGEASAAIGAEVCAGTAGMYAGLAQTLAAAGRKAEAMDALRRVADITDRLPRDVVADEDSMHGWPEVRLRHTESFVHTALGNTDAAFRAQDRALELYPANLARERAAMLLHRATCLVRGGDVGGGIAFATQTLDDLPAPDRTELVHAIGRQCVAAVSPDERRRPDVRGFAERVTERQAA